MLFDSSGWPNKHIPSLDEYGFDYETNTTRSNLDIDPSCIPYSKHYRLFFFFFPYSAASRLFCFRFFCLCLLGNVITQLFVRDAFGRLAEPNNSLCRFIIQWTNRLVYCCLVRLLLLKLPQNCKQQFKRMLTVERGWTTEWPHRKSEPQKLFCGSKSRK